MKEMAARSLHDDNSEERHDLTLHRASSHKDQMVVVVAWRRNDNNGFVLGAVEGRIGGDERTV